MLRIRLTRTGKRNDPRFRIVVAEHTKPIKGKFISIVGHYDPIHKKIVIKKEKILIWLKKGAKPSNRVAILLKKEGLKHPLIIIKKFDKKPKKKKGAKKDPSTTKDSISLAKESKDENNESGGKNKNSKDLKKKSKDENKNLKATKESKDSENVEKDLKVAEDSNESKGNKKEKKDKLDKNKK